MSATHGPRASLGLLVIAAVIAVLYGAGCGSSAAAALQTSVVPQTVTISIDASDGGTVSIGGDVWLDARGGSSGSESEQRGPDIAAEVDTSVAVPISTGGGATTGTTATGALAPPRAP